MNARLLALPAILLALAAVPARAAQEVPVDLRPDASAELKAERTMKSLLDEWAATAFDVRFDARPEPDLAAPGHLKIRLDGLAIAFNAGWYRRYKAFHDQLARQPFGARTLEHALAYCRQGDGRLRATVLDGNGQAVWSGPVTHTRAPSHYAPVEAHLFPLQVRRELPAEPPDLRQLWLVPPGEAPYLVAPPEVARAAKRIRVGDMDGRRWPVDLRDPLAAPARPSGAPAASPSSAAGASPAAGEAPRLAPPVLTPSAAPTARVAPPRRLQR